MAVIKTQFTMRLDIKTQAKLQKIAQLENREEALGEIQLTDDDIAIK